MAASKTTARDELERLRRVVATRMRAVDEIDAERQRALSAVEVARQQQREFYAGLELGAKPAQADEQHHMAAVEAAQRAADAPWDARKEGAPMRSSTRAPTGRRSCPGPSSGWRPSFSRRAWRRRPGWRRRSTRSRSPWRSGPLCATSGVASRSRPGSRPTNRRTLTRRRFRPRCPNEVPVPAPASLVGGRRQLVNANEGGE